MEQFVKNLELLKRYQGITFKDHNVSKNYKIEKLQNSDEKCILKCSDEKWCYVSTKTSRQVMKELDIKYLDEAILVLGFGSGGIVRKILKAYPNNKILVLESDFELLKYSMTIDDLSDILSNPRFSIGVFRNTDDMENIIVHYFGFNNNIAIKSTVYSDYDELTAKEFKVIITSYNNSLNTIIEENKQKSYNILNQYSVLKQYCENILDLSTTDLRQILNNMITLSNDGINVVSRLIGYVEGKPDINMEQVVLKYNQIESSFFDSEYLKEIMNLAMYAYLDTILKDGEFRKKIDDDKVTMQLKDLKRNMEIYKSRKECAEKMLENLNSNYMN